jgi:hypothetical protein
MAGSSSTGSTAKDSPGGHSTTRSALSYVVSELWRLSLDYDPEGTASFATYGYRRGRLLALEWFRVRFGRTVWKFGDGRTHVRERPSVLSLDTDESERSRLDPALGTRAGDPTDDRDPDLSRLLTGGSRQRSRDFHELGLEPPGRAAA